MTLKLEQNVQNHIVKEIKMIIPIRCFSCGKPIGHLWEEYKERTEEKGEDKKKVMDELGIKKYCCRALFMGQVDLLEEVSKFKKF